MSYESTSGDAISKRLTAWGRNGAESAAHQQLLDIIDFLPDAAFVIDQAGSVIAWNRALEQMTGVLKEDVLGRGSEVYAPAFYGKRRPLLVDYLRRQQPPDDGLYDYVERRGETLIAETFVPRLYGGRGAHIWIAARAFHGPDGSVQGAIETVRDVTDRIRTASALRTSEQRYRQVYETAPLAFVLWDTQCRVTGWSRFAETLFGWTFKEVKGRNFFEFLVPLSARPDVKQVVSDLLRGTVAPEVVNENVTKDGRILTCQWHNSVFRNAAGEIEGVLSLGLDISARKRAEADREEYAANLAARNEELDAFAYSVSHDLKSPLVTLEGCAALLAEDYGPLLPPRGRTLLRHIEDAARRMGTLIQDLFELSRLERIQDGTSNISTRAIVQEVAARYRPDVEGRGGALRVPASLPDVWANAQRLTEVLDNLLSNAVKFSRPDVPPEIEVLYRRRDDFHEFGVRDNGIGIDPEQHERVFELFYRLREIEDPLGTGVGLTMVRRIVQHLGGEVRVESKRDAGSTFYFTLPVDPNGRQQHDASAES